MIDVIKTKELEIIRKLKDGHLWWTYEERRANVEPEDLVFKWEGWKMAESWLRV